ncbi:hypothetical protein FRX31_008409 [Thalictrum thalictroides]|uniref:Uncharacterized protein n=1 Tax=Thalictrum thalictroides TaxID=46969 RepID=A0A7J6WY52_THATH|nr:hypothetical protein FRX31_008409 [Thalictrum thalictroides]
MFGKSLVITLDSITSPIGFVRPPIEERVSDPLVLTVEQSVALDKKGILYLYSKTFRYTKPISTLKMEARCKVLYRIMVSTLFCKSGSLAEMPREEAYWLWRAMVGDTIDIPLIIWTQKMSTFWSTYQGVDPI